MHVPQIESRPIDKIQTLDNPIETMGGRSSTEEIEEDGVMLACVAPSLN